ncbi:MAG: restriction endonuclease [Hymenobacteraceae bacterium]|nr:restriction endonuclease [Hymenobacteraceae bacterium]
MAIPDYQTLMLPVLKIASDSKEHSVKQTVENISLLFRLTDDEVSDLLPSGKEPVIVNRVRWSIFYLRKALLLAVTKPGHYKITDRGLKTFKCSPKQINNSFLNQFPEFVEFRIGSKSVKNKDESISNTNNNHTPEEILDEAYQNIRQALAQELLTKIYSLPPSFFEKLVVELLVKMGYGGSLRDAGRALGKSGDGGIDGIIKEDKLGLDVIYIQAKRWNENNPVGRPDLQGFVGALAGHGAKKGVFITTSRFTNDAKAYTPRNETKIVLIDGEQLAQYMIDYNLGVAPVSSYDVKRLDLDYFGDN